VIIVTLAGGVLCAVLFVLLEMHLGKAGNPMLPLKLFRSTDFSGANLLTFFLYTALSGALFFLPLNLIQVHHYSATAAGAALLPFILIMFLLSRWSGGLIKRYGAKLPLMVGPIVVATGYFLFTLTSSESESYWTTFFPAVVVMGLGMAISVAPLTTTVMNAVSENRAGIASGINNAVSRVAGLMAVAVLGIVMLQTFNAHLDSVIWKFELKPEVRKALDEQRTRLAAADLSAVTDPAQREALRSQINESFVAGFRRVALVSSGLAILSALSAAVLIKKRAVGSRQ
jgi:predicted MFS family arabinose efflux permease